jgi:FG-GAP-like repeat
LLDVTGSAYGSVTHLQSIRNQPTSGGGVSHQKGALNAEVHGARGTSDGVTVRRTLSSLLAALLGATALAAVPWGTQAAIGEGDPTLTLSTTSGETGVGVGVSGDGCFLPDGVTGADGMLLQLIAADGSAVDHLTIPVQRDGTYTGTWTPANGIAAATYDVRGTCIAPMYEGLGIVDGGPFTITGEGPAVTEREPVTPQFPSQIEPYPAYDGQSTCSPSPKPGMIAFRDMVMETYPWTVSYGISRDCSIGGTSEHKEGRAWDWAADANSDADRRRVANLMRWLFRTDQYGHPHAMARRLGIMYIIWNRRIFRMYRASEGWSPYTGTSPHTDHVHFSLTWPGARMETSFWTLGMDPPPEPPPPTNNRGPRARFEQTERTVDGHYDFAVPGDYDGDGEQDILWFGQGDDPEVIWWGRVGRGFTGTRILARGRFRPVVGDYNGDGRSDILWYGRGTRRDALWFGRDDRTWRHVTISVGGNFDWSLVGDYEGDGRDDIFWYGPGSASDVIWWGQINRSFAPASVTISGTYRPTAGDYDGDGRDDVFWYGPGSAPDRLWYGKADRSFTHTERTMRHDQTPITGDFNGNGRDDVFWYSPGTAADRVWWGRADRTFASGAVDNVLGTYTSPFAADLDGNGADDIFWYRPGTASDFIWWFQ